MSLEVGIILSIASVVVAIMGYQLNKAKVQWAEQKDVKKEAWADATREAVIETKLDNISNGVESIRIDLKANERQIGELNGRIIRVEESAKQAHKRIDKVEGSEN